MTDPDTSAGASREPTGIATRIPRSEYLGLLEKLPAAVYTCDVDGRITYFNSRAAETWGREPKLNDSAEKFCGSVRLWSTDGTRVEHEQCWVALALRDNREYDNLEVVIERPDGSRVTGLAHAHPLHDEHGTLVGAVNLFIDITDRRSMEEALRDSDRRKDEFLAMLSHELRNPLATIRNSVQLLRMDPGDEMQRTVLEPLERQVSTLSRLVDDLMDVSRVTMGRVRLQRGDVALERIAREAAESVRKEMADRGHTFTVSPVDPQLIVHVDEVRLVQVVVNLLTNAVKYTPDGGVITLSVVREGEEAVLCVRDSGIGIHPELLSHVFGLFSQGATTLDRGQGGLGIGLALVKYLVEMHGGTVAARSAGTGKGSEFTVRLPVTGSSSRPSPAMQPAGTEDTPGNEGALRVLVVDDNRDSADLQATLLRHNGHQVETAYDGSAVLEVALRFRPNVILLDIGLPEIDGYEVAYRIRQHDVLNDVVLVAMTGYGQPEDRRRSQAVGFDHHLVKPAEFSELRAILASVAGRRTPA